MALKSGWELCEEDGRIPKKESLLVLRLDIPTSVKLSGRLARNSSLTRG